MVRRGGLAETARDLDGRGGSVVESVANHESQNVGGGSFFSVQVSLQALQRAGLACARWARRTRKAAAGLHPQPAGTPVACGASASATGST